MDETERRDPLESLKNMVEGEAAKLEATRQAELSKILPPDNCSYIDAVARFDLMESVNKEQPWASDWKRLGCSLVWNCFDFWIAERIEAFQSIHDNASEDFVKRWQPVLNVSRFACEGWEFGIEGFQDSKGSERKRCSLKWPDDREAELQKVLSELERASLSPRWRYLFGGYGELGDLAGRDNGIPFTPQLSADELEAVAKKVIPDFKKSDLQDPEKWLQRPAGDGGIRYRHISLKTQWKFLSEIRKAGDIFSMHFGEDWKIEKPEPEVGFETIEYKPSKLAQVSPKALPKEVHQAEPLQPAKLLASWREITDALGLKHNEQDKVKSLNKRYNGPIPKPRRGGQPIVEHSKLLEWWNKLAVIQQEMENRDSGERLSVEGQHDYGREGRVVPEIGGSVRKNRSDKRK